MVIPSGQQIGEVGVEPGTEGVEFDSDRIPVGTESAQRPGPCDFRAGPVGHDVENGPAGPHLAGQKGDVGEALFVGWKPVIVDRDSEVGEVLGAGNVVHGSTLRPRSVNRKR